MTFAKLDIQAIVGDARARLEAFAGRVSGVPYERKGVLYSEMFFLYLCALRAGPGRILESGRARGQSTLLLARLFPDAPIVSVEHDPASPDVPVAAERLAGYANVELRFGDATRILPAIAQRGDVALIDGPKGFRGLRLALNLLATGRPSMVFVHDCGIGGAERAFLDRNLLGTIYSDHPDFARAAHALDAAALSEMPPERRFENTYPAAGYGYGLACLAFDPAVGYRRLVWRAALAGARERLGPGRAGK